MTLTNVHFLVTIGGLFGLIGFLRGVAREVITTIGIIMAYIVIRWGESFLIRWTNKLHKMILFSVRGGMASDDPTAVWGQVSGLPPFIETDGEKLLFKLIIFVLLVILAYVVGNRVLSGKTVPFGPLVIYPKLSFLSRLLGLATGLMDGYLIANFVIPQAFPKKVTVIRLPTGNVSGFLDENLFFVFIGFVVVLIVFGLRSASLKK